MVMPSDSREDSARDRDPLLGKFIHSRIENTVEAAGLPGAEVQRLTAMICAAIDEFLPTRVEWAAAYWVRVHNHTDRYLQVHTCPQDARRRLDEIERRELRPDPNSYATYVRSALLRRYRNDWVGVNEPNPLEQTDPGDVVDAASDILINFESG